MPNQAPYFDLIPRDPIKNLEWRIRLREAALTDKVLQRDLRQACDEDVLFFFQFALWCPEPRARVKVKPFCLWPHQEPQILEIDRAISESEKDMEETNDVTFDKSRAQGGSLAPIGVIVHRWRRDEMFAACLLSRNMEAADNGTVKSLMGMVDFEVNMLPFWLLPEGFEFNKCRSVSKHTLTNPELHGTIEASASTGDVFSGGRGTVVLFDEVAKFDQGTVQDAMNSTQHVANCRLFVSTHKGDSGVFYDMVFGDQWTPRGKIFDLGKSGVYENGAGGTKVILDWRDNPTQNRLAYVYLAGEFVAVRPEENDDLRRYVAKIKENGNWDKLKRRGFVKEGQIRSPWYDRQCLRKGATPRGIAQELDRDPRGAVGKLFNTTILDDVTKKCARPPLWEGRVMVEDDGGIRLIQQEGGELRLWFKPGLDDEPPRGRFAMGADVASGGGTEVSSNSALLAANCFSGEQVLEYTSSTISPTRFAHLAAALGKWLRNAVIIWEANGPTNGRFSSELRKVIGYGNVWRSEKDNRVYSSELSEKAGWNNNRTGDKADLFDDLMIAMDDELFIPRSEEFLKECGGWEWDSKNKGKIIYSGTGHGDRSIAGGILWKAMKDFQKIGLDKVEEEAQSNAKYGTLAWRMEQDKNRRLRQQDEFGEGFGIRELLDVVS